MTRLILTFELPAGGDVLALRPVLMRLLRSCGFRCVSIRPEQPKLRTPHKPLRNHRKENVMPHKELNNLGPGTSFTRGHRSVYDSRGVVTEWIPQGVEDAEDARTESATPISGSFPGTALVTAQHTTVTPVGAGKAIKVTRYRRDARGDLIGTTGIRAVELKT